MPTFSRSEPGLRHVRAPGVVVEQVRSLSEGVPAAAAGNLGVVAVTTWLLWGDVPGAWLAVWAAAQGALQVGRFAQVLWMRRGGADVPAPAVLTWLRAAVTGSGLGWGVLPVFLFPHDLQHQVFLPFIAAGVSGSALAGQAADRVSAWLFIAATLVPLVGRLFAEQGDVYLAMGVLVLFFGVYLVVVSHRSDRAFRLAVGTRIWAEEQRETLDRAQAVAHVGSFMWHAETGESEWSSEHLRLWQVPPDSTDRSFELFLSRIHPDERASLAETYARATKAGGPYAWVHRIVRPDGSERFIQGRGEVTLSPDGTPVSVVGTVEDITERTRIEQELQALNQELEQRVEARTEEVRRLERQAARSQRLESLGTLASGIAHDLNNALTPIAMGLDGLRGTHPEDAAVLDVFATGVRRATGMVRQLLSFARGGTGEQQTVGVAPLVEEMRRLVVSTFPKSIRMTVELEAGLPSVTGDATQIHQVLLNLCVNARDAMPAGGRIDIRARRARLSPEDAAAIPDGQPGDWVRIEVRDTGTGMPPAVAERIFDPFFTTKATDKGSGLGLSTALGIVRGHGGFVHLVSTSPEGTAFAVYLPAGQAEEPAAPTPEASPVFRGQGEMVLLVDDDATIRAAGQILLRRLGLAPVVASDGIEALARLAEHGDAVRAVITDVQMPNMDGVAFVQAARQTRPHLPIVATSGRLDHEALGVLKAMDVTLFLDKPYTEARLSQALSQLLDGEGADRR